MEIDTTPPQFDFTPQEIRLAASGNIAGLEEQWLIASGNSHLISPDHYDAVDEYNHAQEPAMMAATLANGYAFRTIKNVEMMYAEAYAAHSHAGGPKEFFKLQLEQKVQVSRFGALSKRIGSFLLDR